LAYAVERHLSAGKPITRLSDLDIAYPHNALCIAVSHEAGLDEIEDEDNDDDGPSGTHAAEIGNERMEEAEIRAQCRGSRLFDGMSEGRSCAKPKRTAIEIGLFKPSERHMTVWVWHRSALATQAWVL